MSESKPRTTNRSTAQADGAELPLTDAAGTTDATTGGTKESAGSAKGEEPKKQPGKRDDEGGKSTIANVR